MSELDWEKQNAKEGIAPNAERVKRQRIQRSNRERPVSLDTLHAMSKPSELTEKQLAALAKSEKVRARLDAERAAKRAAKGITNE